MSAENRSQTQKPSAIQAMNNAIKPETAARTFIAPSREELIAEYKAANAEAKAAKAKADLIKELLLEGGKPEWLAENEASPESSIDLGGLKLVASFRPKIVPGDAESETHELALEVKIDGSKIPPRRHGEVVEALNGLGLGKALKVSKGVRAKRTALTTVLRSGGEAGDLAANYTFALR